MERTANVAGNVANLAGYVQVTCENVAGNRQVMWWTIILCNANVAGNVLE